MTALADQLEDLDRARDAHVAALNDNDADAWVACFALYAVQMPPSARPSLASSSPGSCTNTALLLCALFVVVDMAIFFRSCLHSASDTL